MTAQIGIQPLVGGFGGPTDGNLAGGHRTIVLLVIEIPSAVSDERTSSSPQISRPCTVHRSDILRSETVSHVVQKHVHKRVPYSSIPSLTCLTHLFSCLSYLAPRSPLWPSLDTANSDSSPLVGWVQAPPALLSSNPTEDGGFFTAEGGESNQLLF